MVRFFLIASVVVLAGCQSVDTTKPGVVGVDRDQRMMVSSRKSTPARSRRTRR